MSTEQDNGFGNLRFYHSIPLPDGRVTPGECPVNRWERDFLPERVDGLDVLDVGTYDGCYAFECERRGARTVTAIEVWGRVWHWWFGDHHTPSRDAFDYCHKALNSKVVFRNQSVYELNDDSTYDLVIFSQVLYHLEHPLLGLINVTRATKDRVFLETICDFSSDKSTMTYVSRVPYGNDPTNFWLPTWQCLKDMFNHVGLKVQWFKDQGGRVACMLAK